MRLGHQIAAMTGLTCSMLGLITTFDLSHQHSSAIAFEINLGDLLRNRRRARLADDVRELIQQGQEYYQNGQYDLAITAYLQAYEIAKDFNPNSSENTWRATFILDSLAGLGDVYLAQQRFPLAIRTFNRAIREGSHMYTLPNGTASYGAFPQSLDNVRWKLGAAYFIAGQLDEAEAIFNGFVTSYESSIDFPVLNIFGVSDATIDRWRTIDLAAPTPGYNYLQRIMIARGDPIKALEIAERSRSRVLLDYLIDDALPDVPSLTVDNMHQIARDTQATLIFYSKVSDDELYIWVIPPTGTVTFRAVDLTQQAFTTELQTSVSGLLRSMEHSSDSEQTQSEPNSVDQNSDAIAANQERSGGSNFDLQSRYQMRLQEEYQRFIAPIEDVLPHETGARIIIVPDQELFLVPFAALPDANGRYLIERYEISYTSSLQLLAENQRRARSRAPGEQRTIIVSNPSPMPENLSPLPGADIEARAIAGIRPNTSLFSGEYATEEAVKPLLESADVLHFATHGFYDEDRVTNGWIAFAPSNEEDGLLTVREIFKFDLTADLVVLSACTTGRGRITGDGVLGLTRAFIRAGASSVVSSLWSVADDSTSFLMAEFHQQLIYHNATKSAALRAAMLNTMQDYPHPRDWSAFVLIGNPD